MSRVREKVSRVAKKAREGVSKKMVDLFWSAVVEPFLNRAIEATGKSIDILVQELVESGTTLGVLARESGVIDQVKSHPVVGPIVVGLAGKTSERDVEEFLRFLVSDVLPRKCPVLAEMAQRDGAVMMWLRQSIFELWRMIRE